MLTTGTGAKARFNWVAYALSCYLSSNYKESISVMDSFFAQVEAGTMTASENAADCESSLADLMLFRLTAMRVKGDLKGALDGYEKLRSLPLSRYCMRDIIEGIAATSLLLGEFSKAKEVVLELFESGFTEDYTLHNILQLSLLSRTSLVADKPCNSTTTTTTVAHPSSSSSSHEASADRSIPHKCFRAKGLVTVACTLPSEDREVLIEEYTKLEEKHTRR